MFSTGNGLNLPLAIAGGRLRFLGDDILVDQLASSERSKTLDCSLCESLAGNVGNVSDLPPGQCDGFAPAISDIKDFLSTEALAFTYFIESCSLIPSWLTLVPVEDPSRRFGLNAYQVDLQREAIVNNILLRRAPIHQELRLVFILYYTAVAYWMSPLPICSLPHSPHLKAILHYALLLTCARE